MTEQSGSRFLRLFPLQSVVLFPGMELPLVVFEPRYLQLTNECTEADEPFGVLLLRQGREVGDQEAEPHDIGTTAHILSVKTLDEGRLGVTAVGERRFKVQALSHEHPYLSADVDYLDDDPAESVEPSLIANIKGEAAAFVRAMLALRGGYVRHVPFPDDATVLSYQVAQLFQGNAEIQQRLLETRTADRLGEELDLIKSAMDQINRQQRRGRGLSFSSN